MTLRENDRVIVNTGGDDHFGRIERVRGDGALKAAVLVLFDSGGRQWVEAKHVRLAAHPLAAFHIGQVVKFDGQLGKVTRTLPAARSQDGHVEVKDAGGVRAWVPIARVELIF